MTEYPCMPDATPYPSKTRQALVGTIVAVWFVTFAAVGKDAELPFGADRAPLGWIQPLAHNDGVLDPQKLQLMRG